MSEPKTCVTCKWARNPLTNTGTCEAPENRITLKADPTALVVGLPATDVVVLKRNWRLTEMRTPGPIRAVWLNVCGRNGAWWVRDPKTLQPPFGGTGVSCKPPPPPPH